jgi:hypothetical protein
MNLATRRAVTVVAGLSGYGKNTFVLRYLVNAQLSARFLFDPDPGEFNPHVGEFADRLQFEPTCDPYQLSLHLTRPGGWLAFDPHYLFEGNPAAGLDFWCEWCFEKSLAIPGEKAIVVDELWQYVSPQRMPMGIRKAALSGRKAGLKLFVITQEPARMNETLKGACSELVCFRLQSPKQLEFVASLGFDADEVASLAPLAYIARNLDSGGEIRHTIKV